MKLTLVLFFKHLFLFFFRMDIDAILNPFDDERKSIRKLFIFQTYQG
jgi:hypothetical protein